MTRTPTHGLDLGASAWRRGYLDSKHGNVEELLYQNSIIKNASMYDVHCWAITIEMFWTGISRTTGCETPNFPHFVLDNSRAGWLAWREILLALATVDKLNYVRMTGSHALSL